MKYSKFIDSALKTIQNKTIVITGTSSGLGLEMTKVLFRANATVIIGVRNTEKMLEEINKMEIDKINCNFHVLKLDLTDLNSIEEFASLTMQIAENGIDALINNAGIFARKKDILPNGHEIHFFTNCIAPIILSNKLLPALSKKTGSKIVFVSSVSINSVKVNFDDVEIAGIRDNIKTYANSKRWLTYYALEFKKNLKSKNVCVELVHPGISGTSLLHYSHSKLGKFGFAFVKGCMNLIFPSPKKACLSEIYALSHNTGNMEWICPSGPMSVCGYPKIKKIKIKPESESAQKTCYDIISDMIEKL